MKQPPGYLKPTDAWSTVLFADPLGIPLAKLLSRTSIHPNIITFLSLIPGLASAYFFWRGEPLSLVWAGLLFQLAWILDCTDGKLAKMTGKQSEFGSKLDPKIDFIRKITALVMLAWGVYRQFGIIWFAWTAGGVVFHYGVHLFAHHLPPRTYKAPAAPAEERLIPRVGRLYTAFDEQFLILFIGPIFAWTLGHLPTWMLWGASFLYLINAVTGKVKARKRR